MSVKDNLKKGAVEILILKLLSESDMYGYQITQQIAERSGGLFTVLEGSLYPILYRLTKGGYLSERQETVKRRIRIYYHMEEGGCEYLTKCLADYDDISSGIQSVLQSDVTTSQKHTS